MKTILLPLAALAVAGFALQVPASSVRKCNSTPVMFPDAPEPAYVLDGKSVDETVLRDIERERVESIDIVCAPALHELYGVKAQRSGVVIFTRPGPAARLRASLERLVVLQSSYFQAHGAFSNDIDRLGWSNPDSLVSVEITLQDGGSRWMATGSHRYLPRPASSVTVAGPAK